MSGHEAAGGDVTLVPPQSERERERERDGPACTMSTSVPSQSPVETRLTHEVPDYDISIL